MTQTTEQTAAEATIAVDASVDRAFEVFTRAFGACKPAEHNLLAVPIDETVVETHVGGHIIDRGPRAASARGPPSYVYRAVDQHGQVIDVHVSQRRDIASARTFFTAALAIHGDPAEVITDRAPALVNVIEELVPGASHNTGQYQNNRVECDHGRLKARLRPMRGLKSHRTASVVIRGHAFIQNLRRGQYELAVDDTRVFRSATAFDELRPAI